MIRLLENPQVAGQEAAIFTFTSLCRWNVAGVQRSFARHQGRKLQSPLHSSSSAIIAEEPTSYIHVHFQKCKLQADGARMPVSLQKCHPQGRLSTLSTSLSAPVLTMLTCIPS